MTLKDRVLVMLEDASRSEPEKGYLSGGKMAKALNVSRAAVWKAIRALRNDGNEIEAAKKKGYMLKTNGIYDRLTADAVFSKITSETKKICPGIRVLVYDSLPSTNRTMRDIVSGGRAFSAIAAANAVSAMPENAKTQLSSAKEGLVIIAKRQTDGHGRYGRSFYSPSGSGLYMSILLRPSIVPEKALLITTAAASATALAIEAETGKKMGIKWVNDLFYGGRKVCGILTEASMSIENGGIECAVLGIGIDVYEPEEYPDEIRGIAGALVSRKELNKLSGKKTTSPDADKYVHLRSRIAAAVINNFMKFYAEIEKTQSSEAFFGAYSERLNCVGAVVTVRRGDEEREAEVLGIDENFGLQVKFMSVSGTETATLTSGEIISFKKSEVLKKQTK